MSITPEALRGQFKISQLGQVFEATLHLCMEEGFPRHQLHYQPSPLIPDDREKRLVLPDAQVACIFGLTRFSSLNIPAADQAAFTRKPPYESLYLTLPVSELGKANQRRIRFLQEAENLFLDLAERKDRVFVESISHRRLVHGRVVVRHQPVATGPSHHPRPAFVGFCLGQRSGRWWRFSGLPGLRGERPQTTREAGAPPIATGGLKSRNTSPKKRVGPGSASRSRVLAARPTDRAPRGSEACIRIRPGAPR